MPLSKPNIRHRERTPATHQRHSGDDNNLNANVSTSNSAARDHFKVACINIAEAMNVHRNLLIDRDRDDLDRLLQSEGSFSFAHFAKVQSIWRRLAATMAHSQ
jgi:hypothetical protein